VSRECRFRLDKILLDAFDQVDNDLDAAAVVMSGRLFAQANDFLPVVCEGDPFDFCATPVDSNEHKKLFSVHPAYFDSGAHAKEEITIP
jgi:hypothetical protein